MLAHLATPLLCFALSGQTARPSALPAGKPSAAQPTTAKTAAFSILPSFDTTRSTVYAFRSTSTSQESHGTKKFDPSIERATWHVRITPVSIDAEKHEVEVEAEFAGIQVEWSHMGFIDRYDSTVPFKPKQPKPKKPGMEPDGVTLDDVPLDKVMFDRFSPLHGAKVRMRLSERGEVLELKDAPALPVKPFRSVSPYDYLYELFTLPATNRDSDFTGTVRTGQAWTCEQTDSDAQDEKKARIRIADYKVRTANKARVEVEAVTRLKDAPGAKPPAGAVYDDKSAYVWDPAAGQLASAKLTVVSRFTQQVMGKDHGFNYTSEVSIERLKSEQRKPVSTADKPAAPPSTR